MADYSSDIDTDLYEYRQPVYITEPTGERQTFIPLKLNLNSSNFNFDLSRSDGLDFRLAERSNGTGVFQMWIAYWDDTKNLATLWFKIPEILAGEVKTLYAYWGYENDTGISDLDDLLTGNSVFHFGDDFDTPSLDTSKWTTSNGSWSIGGSKIYLWEGAWIRTYTGAISTSPPVNWMVEEGIVGVGSPTSTSVAAHRYRFYGGENVLGINYYWEGSTDRRHDFIYAATYSTYNGTNKGLQIGSYSQNYLGYYEPTDRVYQGMANRDSYSDYDDSWERKVNRNTEVTNFRIYSEAGSTANGIGMDWVIVRDYNPNAEPVVDYSELYVQHEYIGHQLLDFTEYQSDATSVDFHHLSDMGGDPYRMSDNITNSVSNIFVSDTGTTEGDLIIDFGRGRYSATDVDYIHFNDEDTVEYYNASKLSDLDEDVHSRDYWQTTTTSGWAAIQFPSIKDVTCLSMRAVPGNTSRMAKNFKFYGSQSDPRFSGWDDKVLIYEDQARATEDDQAFYFSTGLTLYEYYILEVLDTHGGNIAIQEWGMYESISDLGKKSISQLRLHPAAFDSNEYFFPKQIEFYGSNDGFNWDTLVSLTDTPTPFTDYTYGRWSRYSFTNIKTYYQYKLTCHDNWNASTSQMKIAEWEMVERTDEIYNIRILAGSTNNINNIWADPNTTISSGTLYIANEELSTVEYEKLIEYATVSGAVADFNVRL